MNIHGILSFSYRTSIEYHIEILDGLVQVPEALIISLHEQVVAAVLFISGESMKKH
jgi:hypothetical protein